MINVIDFFVSSGFVFICCAIINSILTTFIVSKQLKTEKFTIKNYFPLIIITIIGLVAIFVFSEYMSPVNYYEDDFVVEVDNRTPKEKFIDYLEDYHDAVYYDDKCTYQFSSGNIYGGTDTIYYTIDFTNKKFTQQSYFAGNSYDEYNWGNDTAYGKHVSNVGWTTTTEVNITLFDDNTGQYTYTWNSSLPGADDLAESVAESSASLRSELRTMCSNAGISIYDL